MIQLDIYVELFYTDLCFAFLLLFIYYCLMSKQELLTMRYMYI